MKAPKKSNHHSCDYKTNHDNHENDNHHQKSNHNKENNCNHQKDNDHHKAKLQQASGSERCYIWNSL